MIKISKFVEFESGNPQSRIKKSYSETAKTYPIYNQSDLKNDMHGLKLNLDENKIIKTEEDIMLLKEGDLIFSLISGEAVVVGKMHEGYTFTQNYVRLITDERIDNRYLAYILNENQEIKRQFFSSIQGSTVMKYTVRQLRNLKLPNLLDIKKQEAVGRIYFSQLKINGLKKRVQDNETKILFEILSEVVK